MSEPVLHFDSLIQRLYYWLQLNQSLYYIVESYLNGLYYTDYSLLTAIASLALPSVPSSSIVTLIMVLSSLNIPVHAVSLLFAVEWFLWVYNVLSVSINISTGGGGVWRGNIL